MILAGWECCDKWESWAKTGGEPWNDADEKVAAASMASEARLLRNHPSVIGFLIGSDNAPPPALSKLYVDTLHAEDWPMPIISAAVPAGHARDRPFRHEDGRALLVDSSVVLVCRQAGWRLRVRLRSQRGRLHPAAGRPDPHARRRRSWRRCGKIPRLGSSTRRPRGRYSRRSSLSTSRSPSATARPGASTTTSPRRSSTTTTTSERNSRRSTRTRLRRSPRPASSTGCSTTPGPRCTGICTTIS